jgi:hypothetical protein
VNHPSWLDGFWWYSRNVEEASFMIQLLLMLQKKEKKDQKYAVVVMVMVMVMVMVNKRVLLDEN